MPATQRKDPALSALLSFLIPGAGHFYCGKVGAGIAFFVGTIAGYMLFVIPGLAVHGFAVYGAYQIAKEGNDSADQIDEQARTLERQMLRPEEFVDAVRKVHKLFVNEILTDAEYRDKKKALIADIANKKPAVSTDDFLGTIIVLKEQEILNHEEIGRIKSLLA